VNIALKLISPPENGDRMKQQEDYNIAELKMMFNKISLITSLLFFLLGTNVFADSRLEVSSPQNNPVLSPKTQIVTLTSDNNKIVLTNKKTKSQMEHASLPFKQVKDAVPTFKNYIIPSLVGLLFIFGFGSYWLVFRRKHT
jgi:hypothetical protein